MRIFPNFRKGKVICHALASSRDGTVCFNAETWLPGDQLDCDPGIWFADKREAKLPERGKTDALRESEFGRVFTGLTVSCFSRLALARSGIWGQDDKTTHRGVIPKASN